MWWFTRKMVVAQKQQILERDRVIAEQNTYIRELENDLAFLIVDNNILRQLHWGVELTANVASATVRAVATGTRCVSDSAQAVAQGAQWAAAAVTNAVQNAVRVVQGVADGSAASGFQAGFERFVGREAIAKCCRRASRRTSNCK
jgi:hypothetical protein